VGVGRAPRGARGLKWKLHANLMFRSAVALLAERVD